jgi:hypothetical protein
MRESCLVCDLQPSQPFPTEPNLTAFEQVVHALACNTRDPSNGAQFGGVRLGLSQNGVDHMRTDFRKWHRLSI